MIRKFLILIAITFSLIWFVSAYLIKTKLAYQLENLKSDSFELSYDKITVAGFPNIWKVKIKEPELKFVNHTNFKDISTDEIECIFDLSFKKANLIIKNKIKHEEDFGQQKNSHYLNLERPILITIKFDKPFYRFGNQDSIKNTLKTFKFSNVNLNGTFEDEKIFSINNFSIILNKTNSRDQQDISLKIQGRYKGQNYILGFNSANLNFDSVITYPGNLEGNETAPIKIFKVSKFNLNIDDDSDLSMSGSIQNYVNKLPQGQFVVNLANYPKLVDKLVSQNFIISKSALKQIIAEALIQDKLSDDKTQAKLQNNEAAFEVQFSDTGIKIGSVNLLDIGKNNQELDDEIDN